MTRFPELKDNQQRGSKPRSHLFTDGASAEVAARLTSLVKPQGSVSASFNWLPRGFDDVEEVQLHKLNGLVSAEVSHKLENWWFAKRGGSGVVWDLASQCVFGRRGHERSGLLLVEAKAHTKELKTEGKKKPDSKASANSCKNHERIGEAIREANEGLKLLTGQPEWTLSRDSCYQMANRFAWAWKLVSLGTPVTLVYLGFLDAIEMSDQGEQFRDHADWVECIKKHANGSIPEDAWDQEWKTQDGILFMPRIISVRQPLRSVRMPR